MLDILRKSYLFGDINDEELAEVGLFVKPFNLQKGEYFFKQGQLGDDIFLIQDGLVELYVQVALDKEEKVANYGSGDCFGELSIFGDGLRTASAISAKNSSGLIISSKIFELIKIIRKPGYADVLRKLLVRASGSLKEMTNLMSENKDLPLQTLAKLPDHALEEGEIKNRREPSDAISANNLQLFHLFKEFSLKSLELILPNMNIIKLKKRDLLFFQGTKGVSCYIVVSGAMQIVFSSGIGKAEIHKKIAFIPPGRPFGHLAFFDGSTRSASAIACENTSLLEMDHKVFNKLISDGSNEGFLFLNALIDDLVESMRNTNRRFQFSISQPLLR
jgi:CRP/FNR family transcriptional regulator